MANTGPSSCGINHLGALPGDPSNDGGISARSVLGGILVSWDLPTTNPQAVSYVKILRSGNTDVNNATQVGSSNGGSFLDRIDGGAVTYSYWICPVSINGTVLGPIGPATASTAGGGTIGQLIELLSGQIDESVLAQALTEKIADIPSIRNEVESEVLDRIRVNGELYTALSALGVDINGTNAAIVTERVQRITNEEAVAEQFSAVVSSIDGNAALITLEQNTRATAVSALAQQISTVAATTNTNVAAIVSEQNARTTEDQALAQQITTVAASQVRVYRQNNTPPTDGVDGSIWFDSNDGNKVRVLENGVWLLAQDQQITAAFAAIQSEQTARTQQNQALAQDITTLQASVSDIDGDIDVKIQAYDNAQVGFCMINGRPSSSTSHDTKTECQNAGGTWLDLRELAQAVKGVEISGIDGNIKLEQRMQAYRTELGHLNGEYTVKIDSNGLVGGFGLAADGNNNAISAGFNVNTFWIGEPGDNANTGNYPFLVSNGVVYIKNAVIENLTIGTIKLAQNAASVQDFETFQQVSVQSYSGANSYSWKHRFFTSGRTQHKTARDLHYGALSSTHGDFSQGGIFVPGSSSEQYDLVIDISFVYCLESSQTSDPNIVLEFTPRWEVYRRSSGSYYTQLFFANPVIVNTQRCFGHAHSASYTTSLLVNNVRGDSVANIKFDEANMFTLDRSLGSNPGSTVDGNYIRYGAIMNPRYTFSLKLR